MAAVLDEVKLQTKLKAFLSSCESVETLTIGKVLSRLEVDLGVPRSDLEPKKNFLVEVMRQEVLARMEQSRHMSLIVEATGESGKTHSWRWTLGVHEPLKKAAQQWAKAHHVPVEAVGFDVLINDSWKIVDLRQSPSSLMLTGSPVLRAFPVDGAGDSFAEKERAREKKRKDVSETAAPPAKRDKSEPAKRDKSEASAKSERAADSAPDKVKLAVASVDGISESDPVKFEQTNPKRAGTAAWDRYEKYKSAKTMQEALSLGAAKADFSNDVSRGFCKRV